MKQFLLYLIIFMILSSCATAKKEKVQELSPEKQQELNAEIRERFKIAEIEKEIRAYKENSDFYWGEGWADINNEYSLARQKAKENAMTELSRAIQVRVSSDMIRVISNVSVTDKKRYSEYEQEILEQKSRLYTDIILSNIRFEKFYDDYPRKGVITAIVNKSVEEYQQQVTNELNNNKAMISDVLRAADREYRAGRFLNAYQNWIKALEIKENIFGKLPLMLDIESNGQEQNAHTYIEQRIVSLFSAISLSLIDEQRISYDIQGNLTKRPVVVATYTDRMKRNQSVSGLPLKISVIEGKADLVSELKTGQYGHSEIFINYIDASHSTTTINVSVDFKEIKEIENFVSTPVSFTLSMEKIKTIAISVSWVNENRISYPTNLLNDLKTQILNRGFAVIELKYTKEDLHPDDVQDIIKSNADYFLNVYLSSTAQAVGGFQNMFNGECQASIKLYKLPLANIVASESLPIAKGYGSSSTNAGLNAFNAMQANVKQTIDMLLGDL